MKKIIYSALVALAFVGVSCSSDNDDNSVKPNSNVRYLTELSAYDNDDKNDGSTASFKYDAQNRLIEVVNYDHDDPKDIIKSQLIFGQDGRLEKVGEGNEFTLMSTVLGYKDEAYKIGKVLEYDNNKNPKKMLAYYEDETEDYKIVIKQGTVEVTYDNTPFFAFHTMRAAGIISLLDGVNLNFNAPTQAPQLKLAKELLPTTNPVKMVFKNEESIVVNNVSIVYNYDAEQYPINASVETIRKERQRDYKTGALGEWKTEIIKAKVSYLFKK